MDPVEGAKNDGSLGFLKGLGTGSLDLFVRSAAGGALKYLYLIVGFWALPAYTLKGMQMSSRNHNYRHEFNGIFSKRFLIGLRQYQNSTQSEREEVLKLWTEMGFESRVKARGEIKERDSICPIRGCSLELPHNHHVDGDADIRGIRTHTTM